VHPHGLCTESLSDAGELGSEQAGSGLGRYAGQRVVGIGPNAAAIQGKRITSACRAWLVVCTNTHNVQEAGDCAEYGGLAARFLSAQDQTSRYIALPATFHHQNIIKLARRQRGGSRADRLTHVLRARQTTRRVERQTQHQRHAQHQAQLQC
jgi:hypothetical protein